MDRVHPVAGWGERTYKPGFEIPPAPQGAPNRLVAWPGVRHRRPRALASRLRWSRLCCLHLRRWGPGLQLLRPRPSTSAQRRRARHLSGARTRAAADAVLSNRERGSGEDCGVAAAIHDHKLRVRLRRVRLHHAPKARVGALDDNARSFGNLGLLAHTVTWQDRNRLSSKLGQALSSCSHLDGLGSCGARATGSKDCGPNWWVGKIGTFRPPRVPRVQIDPQTDKALAPRGAWLRQKSCQEISCTEVALLILKKCVSSDAL